VFVGLNESVTVEDIDYLVHLVVHFKKEIRLHTPHNSTAPPYRLPAYLHLFFKTCLDLDDVTVIQLWGALKDDLWSAETAFKGLTNQELQAINAFGITLNPHEQLGSSDHFSCNGSKSSMFQLPTCFILLSPPVWNANPRSTTGLCHG
jgi:hypothetical protein